MSLRDAKRPRLLDKIEAAAALAEQKRADLELKDLEEKKIIKKSAKKN